MNWIGAPTDPLVPVKLGDLVILTGLTADSEVTVEASSGAVDAGLRFRPIAVNSIAKAPEPSFGLALLMGCMALGGLVGRRGPGRVSRRRRLATLMKPPLLCVFPVVLLSLVHSPAKAVETIINMTEVGDNAGIMGATLSGTENFGNNAVLSTISTGMA